MEAPSLRRIVLEAGGSTSGISIRRHLAPRTAGPLLRALPGSGNPPGPGGGAPRVGGAGGAGGAGATEAVAQVAGRGGA